MPDPNEDRIELLPIRKDDGPEVVHEPNLEIQVFSYDELGRWFKLFGRAPKIQLPVVQAEHRKPEQEDSGKESLERRDLASPEEEAKKKQSLDGRDRESPEELEPLAQEEIPLFVIVGPQGIGKTKHMKQVVPNEALYIEGGRISPMGLYCDLYAHRFDPKVVIDDAESVLKDGDGRNLAKGICQTSRIKTVSWRTMSKELKERGVPRSYQTTASLGIITNDEELLKHKLLGPLLSRGVLIKFGPSKYEIHDKTQEWFLDGQEISDQIYSFMGSHLDQIKTLDMRLYYNARIMGRRGGDWRSYLKERLLGWDSKEILAERLMKDPSYATIEERFAVFHRLTGRSRSTFNDIITKRGLRARKALAPTPPSPAPAPPAPVWVPDVGPVLDNLPECLING